MNEVLAPIYYVFCQEIDETAAVAAAAAAAAAACPAAMPPSPAAGAAASAGGASGASDLSGSDADDPGRLPESIRVALDAVEADAFFCFTNIMAEVRDHFCSKLDNTSLGITTKVCEENATPSSQPRPLVHRYCWSDRTSDRTSDRISATSVACWRDPTSAPSHSPPAV